MSFKQQLIELKACQDAIDWVKDRTLQQAWDECHRGDWMLWLLEEMEGKEGWLNEKEIMLLWCWSLRKELECLSVEELEEEQKLLKAIEMKEKWARGEISQEEMDATYDVVRFSVRSVIGFYVVLDTFDEKSLIQADYIRSQFTLPKGDLCLLNNN